MSLYVVWNTRDAGPSVRLLMGKCRVAPLLGMTIPRGEMQSLVILTRLTLVAAEEFPTRFESISSFTDSMCSIGALMKTSTALKPFFGNRVSEIQRLRLDLSEMTDNLAPVHHIPGELNPADIGTRGGVKVEELGCDSLWQCGPEFLGRPYEEWPTTREDVRSKAEVPAEEAKKTQDVGRDRGTVTLATSAGTTTADRGLLHVVFEAIHKEDKLGSGLIKIAQETLSREKLELTVNALARVLGGVISGDREKCCLQPRRVFLEIATQVLIRASSASARAALHSGRLQGLGATARGGVVWVQGRVRGETLAHLLGTSELPVIMPTELPAKSISRKAHRSDHRRSPQDISARTRRLVWIMGSTRVAKVVARQCYECRLKDKRMAKQQMGSLPDERVTVLAPFEAVALDLFGPYQVRDPVKGRRQFKCWVVALVCLATKATSLLACPGYDTPVFLDVFRFFSGIYGKPRLVYTDHAPSLVTGTHDWADIAIAVGRLGTQWKLTAKGCSWRNGLAERVIRAARHTLSHELTRGGKARLPSVQRHFIPGCLHSELSATFSPDDSRRRLHGGISPGCPPRSGWKVSEETGAGVGPAWGPRRR